jgi:L-iditol 2-dehydrogenase
MKGLLKTAKGPGNMAIQDVDEPSPGPGQVRVRVKWAGIFGTDVHIALGEYFYYFLPVFLGHEFAGEVDEIGEGVEGVSVGDRVAVEPTKSACGKCLHCGQGNYNRCEERDIAGVVSHGAFTNYVITRSASLHKLPDSVSFKAAALTEPLAVCVHGLCEQCRLSEGDTVLVVGPGTIGLCCAQVAMAHGARVIVAGTSRDRSQLALAERLGAFQTVNVEEDDLEKSVSELTSGVGVDMAVEAVGGAAPSRVCLEAVRKGGQILQVGLPGEPVAVDLTLLAWKEIWFAGTFGQKYSAWKAAIGLLEAGKVDMEAMVSDVLPLADWEAGFGMMERGEGLKVLLEPYPVH